MRTVYSVILAAAAADAVFLVLLRALPRKASHHGRYGHTLRHDARAHEQLALAALAVGERLGEGKAGAAAGQKQGM
jgi:hypothetical protein